MSRQRWPSATEYVAAVANSTTAFRVRPLAHATYATAALIPGMDEAPAVASGQNAVVFEAEITGYRQAVRCFTTEPVDGRLRYAELGRHLRSSPVPAIASAHWVDDAVEIDGSVFPVVTMEWVDGLPMNTWVGQHLDDAAAILRLAERWTALLDDLRRSRVAHGDLQHGNVLIDAAGRPRLIDLDGIWVPGVADHPPTEVGHPNYQHPHRLATGTWGEHVDWFSALVVYVSLVAVASDPSLWRHQTGENLLFTKDDLADPGREVWAALRWNDDLEVRRLTSVLADALEVDPGASLDLNTVLHEGVGRASRLVDTSEAPRPASPPPRASEPRADEAPEAATSGAEPATPAPSPGEAVAGDVFADAFADVFGPAAAPPPPPTAPPSSPRPPKPGPSTTSSPPPPPPPQQARPPKPGSSMPPPPPRPRPPKPGAGTTSSPPPPPPQQSRPPKPGARAPSTPPPTPTPPPAPSGRPPKPPSTDRAKGGRTVGLVLLFGLGFALAGSVGNGVVLAAPLLLIAVFLLLRGSRS